MKTKYFILLSMMFFILTPRYFSQTQSVLIDNTQQTQKSLKKILLSKQDFYVQKPQIESRASWHKNYRLLAQYAPNRKVGDIVSFPIFGKTRYRKIKEISYLKYCRDSCVMDTLRFSILMHHTAIEWDGDAVAQAKFICEGEILDPDYKFTDIAYHFFISSDGKIKEGRPMTHMGTHAGKIVEKGICLDPDFGSIGIVLMGNIDKRNLYLSQKLSRDSLVNWLKWEYDIPNVNIHYHREVKGLVEEACLTSLSKDKTCPGKLFESKEEFLKGLIEDTEESVKKKKFER